MPRPGFAAFGSGLSKVPLEFIDPDGQISQRGHGVGSRSASDAAGIFTEADIATMVDAVFDAGPVISDRGMELCLGILVVVGAGDVVADFVARLVVAAKRNTFASHGDNLPAAAKADLLRSHR